MRRREVLLLAGGSIMAATAGCVDEFSDDDDGEGDEPAADTDTENGGDEGETGTGDENGQDENGEEDNGEEANGEEENGDENDEPETQPEDLLEDEEFELGESFELVGQGGFIAFSEDEENIPGGLSFPVQAHGEEAITIAGEVTEDNRWESTSVEFPSLETDSGIEAIVSAPDGLEGDIHTDELAMTLEGKFNVEVPLIDDDDDNFNYTIAATTGESGALTGDIDFSTTPATVSLVDNEFIIEEETGSGVVNSALDLPSTESGRNWIDLKFHLHNVE